MITRIKNCRPYTVNSNGSIDNRLMTDEPLDVKHEVLKWITENIHPRKTPNLKHTSYGLKHIFQRDTKIYLTNNEFKDAMMICGYYPTNEHKLNWTYCISQKSPAFKRKSNSYDC